MFTSIILLLLIIQGECVKNNNVSLDLWMSFPTRTKLTAHPSSDTIAWVETVRGVSNVYAFSSGRTKKLTEFSSDEKESENMEITDMFVDNQYVYFSRLPIAESNALGLIRGKSRRTTYRLHPSDGVEIIHAVRDRQVVNVRNGFIYSVQLKSLYVTNIVNNSTRVLFSVSKGTIKDFTFRPGYENDVVFVNDRGTHAFLGLFSDGLDTIQWICPSADSASQPAFSSDGKYLAWLSTYPSHEDVTAFSASDGNQGNKGPLFQIHLGELTKKNEFIYLGEKYRDERVGLASFGYGNRPLVVLKDGTILFGVEETGWLQITSFSDDDDNNNNNNNHLVRQRSNSKCEERNWIYDDRYEELYVSSNCDNLDSRGIDRYHTTSEFSKTNIVRGNEYVVAGGQDMVVSKSFFAWFESRGTEPNFVRIQDRNGDSSVISDDAVSNSEWALHVKPFLIRPTPIVFESKPYHIHASLFRSMSPSSSSVVYTHGGSERQSFAAFHFSSHYATEQMFNQYLAVVLNLTVMSINRFMHVERCSRVLGCSRCGESSQRRCFVQFCKRYFHHK